MKIKLPQQKPFNSLRFWFGVGALILFVFFPIITIVLAFIWFIFSIRPKKGVSK